MTQDDSAVSPIHVTKAFLPPRDEFDAWMDRVYTSHILTNQGPIHQELEQTLHNRFGVRHFRLMSNGTLALQLAIRALGVKGTVITTPFSYVATTSAILWEGCEPLFVDIDPSTCCIDPNLIEQAITPDTTAILATHVYGIPCDVEAIETIAQKHGLKVIYDAAHAFDVMYKGRSILEWGDASTLSFHATKLFHTVEGGAVVLQEEYADKRLLLLRSFGHSGDNHFILGMNAKMSEVHAAMGMAVLPHVQDLISRRRSIVETYDRYFSGMIERPSVPDGTILNHAYYPVFFRDPAERDHVIRTLALQGIYCRRYFYPSLDELPYVHGAPCPVSRAISGRVVCLPLFPELEAQAVVRISKAVLAALVQHRDEHR